MKYSPACTISVLAILLTYAVVAMAQDRRSDLDDKYRVISERNMFLRDRQRPRQPSTRDYTTRPVYVPPPEIPEQKLVLRGIVIEDNELRAYFEKAGGGIIRTSPGDQIATGMVAQIVIDAIAYEHDGQVKWIEIGQNLEGNRGSVPTRTASAGSGTPTTSATSSTGSGDAPAADPSTLSVAERMRLRRLSGGN